MNYLTLVRLHERLNLFFKLLESLPVTADNTVEADQGGAVAEEFEKNGLERAFDFLFCRDAVHTFIITRQFGMSI